MSKLTLLTCFVLYVKYVTGQWAIDDDGCITPFRGSGSCESIYNCRPLTTFLRNAPQPLSSENRRILQGYQCGFEQNNIKVCCPSDPTEIARLEGVGQESEPAPPDVSGHRNLRLLPEDCGRLDTDVRIINGNQTGLFEFPWMALLSYRLASGLRFGCGGTIINNRYILTAAHCIAALKNPLIGVRVGEHDLRTKRDCETVKNRTTCAPPVQDVAIDRLIIHPEYNTSLYSNDIGLIRLATRLRMDTNVAPICMPITNELASYNFSGRQVIVTGFGTTETGAASPTLLKVQIPYIERSVCRKTHEASAPVSHRQLCAGGRNKHDSCGGDSGGPLQVATSYLDEPRYVQHGITSFGPKNCGAEGFPGVYTRVAYYVDWILDNISS
ncbi:serine protease grass-like [Harmonia axyridis]|uniref:serine protease grass-like n=1 Tax=Harmonia axyridis TaxID=115357 RepID=UPI001E279805|nr:serine protease grass-like [Harmonia axyridis]